MLLRKDKARAISFSGIVLAFNLIIFALINILPLNTIAMLVLASLLSSVIVIETGVIYSLLFAVAANILGFFIISNKIHFFTYLIVFSFYGIIKYLIEKNINTILIQYLLKLVYSIFAFVILFYLVLLLAKLDLNFIYIIGFEAAFLVYDYFYSMFIKYYIDRIRKYIKK